MGNLNKDSPYYYYNLFPVELSDWMKKHVNIQWNNNLPSAAVELSADKGYVIELNKEFMEKLSDNCKKKVILHVISHIVRGDCLTIKKCERPRDYNIASDAHINTQIGDLTDLEEEANTKVVTYERIREEDWPEGMPSTKIIYDLLAKKSKQQSSKSKENSSEEGDDDNNCGNGKKFVLSDDIKGTEGDFEVCIDKHIEAIATVPKALGAGINIRFDRFGSKVYEVRPKPEPKILTALKKLLRYVVPKYGTTKVKVKTWTRENRSNDLFRGCMRKRKVKVCLAVDVSGSMREYVPNILGIAADMKHKLDTEIIVWADYAQKIRSVDDKWDVGCGTDVNPAIELINKINPDISVIITDGDFYRNIEKVPRTPVLWVLYGDFTCSHKVVKKTVDQIIKISA
jgi:predicted metal-dependent peptidase